MLPLILAIGSFIPSMILVHQIYLLDRFREPLSKVAFAFIIGVFSPLITLLITGELNSIVSHLIEGDLTMVNHPWLYSAFLAAIPEEVGRLILLLIICKVWKEIDEPFDCVVYGAAIWGGFAGIENVLYVSQVNAEAGFTLSLRAVLCSTGHTAWGVIAGGHVGIALFGADQRFSSKFLWIAKGIAITSFLHFLYDGFLFSLQSDPTSQLWLIFGRFGGAIFIDLCTLLICASFIYRMWFIQRRIGGQFEGEYENEQSRIMANIDPSTPSDFLSSLKKIGLMGLGQLFLLLFLIMLGFFSSIQIFLVGKRALAIVTLLSFFFAAILYRKVYRRFVHAEAHRIEQRQAKAYESS